MVKELEAPSLRLHAEASLLTFWVQILRSCLTKMVFDFYFLFEYSNKIISKPVRCQWNEQHSYTWTLLHLFLTFVE